MCILWINLFFHRHLIIETWRGPYEYWDEISQYTMVVYISHIHLLIHISVLSNLSHAVLSSGRSASQISHNPHNLHILTFQLQRDHLHVTDLTYDVIHIRFHVKTDKNSGNFHQLHLTLAFTASRSDYLNPTRINERHLHSSTQHDVSCSSHTNDNTKQT